MSESARLIDAVVREFIAPVMKEAGYRKTARSWYADDGHVVRMLNVQGSTWNSASSARFTINLGVWFDGAAALSDGPPVSKRRPPEYLCTVRERIGALLDPRGDLWWTVSDVAGVPDAGRSSSSLIRDVALPWLIDLADPRRAIEHLVAIGHAGHSPTSAFALALSLGDRDLASTMYSDWAATRAPETGAAVDEWAARHDLTG